MSSVTTSSPHPTTSEPFAVLAGAGVISARLRLRTYVLNVGFWQFGPDGRVTIGVIE